MTPTRRFQFSLNISPDEYLAYYRGTAKYIQTTTASGETIKFPASSLKKHLTHNGIHGHFEIEICENNKLLNINKINVKSDKNGIWL
ncbi:hypothetical protein KsCSTR_49650 [Candidatus Kuenenia stuttgartiensis]|jgi:hypothetical protein|uniref:DUF2835 domain-containing protein n=1 Tax=Kuenenia stuttgartiensis TaxID=174633 RepID=A0A6G7GYB7_KUEST|nr:DUF2835 domain-containing protein [Candidatus Kuenenia stuttgartiensis]MBZ0191985.1 DUF2835 domain-containing protein [Candidatus Kuenenia stuttgartiensis]QII14342.1 hypothetical protein KsCSTR_49650 [Candidatus Kuenenia stuttgartiensis]TVM02107.1 MAG: DUF2835 domain-containing protein [Candidatus Kuenenia stuttgartiensis]